MKKNKTLAMTKIILLADSKTPEVEESWLGKIKRDALQAVLKFVDNPTIAGVESGKAWRRL